MWHIMGQNRSIGCPWLEYWIEGHFESILIVTKSFLLINNIYQGTFKKLTNKQGFVFQELTELMKYKKDLDS